MRTCIVSRLVGNVCAVEVWTPRFVWHHSTHQGVETDYDSCAFVCGGGARKRLTGLGLASHFHEKYSQGF